EDHRRDRRSAGNCQNPRSFGPADPRPAARASAAIRFIPNDLRNQNRLPTRADGPARSEFERAVRSRTLRAPPTAAPPEPTEVKPRFSSDRKEIDNSPVRRYSSRDKKRWFKIPIQIPRGQQGGCAYHVINRGNGRTTVFHKPQDYEAFLSLPAEAKERHRVKHSVFA